MKQKVQPITIVLNKFKTLTAASWNLHLTYYPILFWKLMWPYVHTDEHSFLTPSGHSDGVGWVVAHVIIVSAQSKELGFGVF